MISCCWLMYKSLSPSGWMCNVICMLFVGPILLLLADVRVGSPKWLRTVFFQEPKL
ncbi:hypothetical protein Hanom_Chr00s097589g01802041 [Helianthus anomalus]